MDILFGSKSLKELCHDDRLATRSLGAPTARKLRARLDDLSAISSLSYASKLPGRFHALTGDRKGQYAFDLHGGSRLVIEPADNPLPLLADKSVDLARVTTIRVAFIGDYHE